MIFMIFDTIKVALDFLYQHWKCHFLAPQYGQTESARVKTSKKAVPMLAQKIQDHFYNSNFPQKWGLCPLILLLVIFDGVFFDDFHYQALLGPILEGKSDQNENAILQSKETSNKKVEKANPLLNSILHKNMSWDNLTIWVI